jgi:hypothetical protein
MSNRFHAATRKGLFTIDRRGSGWSIARAGFLATTAGSSCTIRATTR